jgi:hypothetical protein
MTQMVLAPSSRRKSLRIGVAVLATGIASGVAFNFERVTDAIGRDPTLTGRTTLWGLVYEAIQEKPLLGYGYEAFWQGGNGLAGDIWAKLAFIQGIDPGVGQNLFYSHNGFLEVCLGLGLVGLVVFTACLVSLVVKALHLVRKPFCLDTVWPWLFLSYLILSNLAEASYMKSNTLPWILFSILVLNWSEDLKRTERNVHGLAPWHGHARPATPLAHADARPSMLGFQAIRVVWTLLGSIVMSSMEGPSLSRTCLAVAVLLFPLAWIHCLTLRDFSRGAVVEIIAVCGIYYSVMTIPALRLQFRGGKKLSDHLLREAKVDSSGGFGGRVLTLGSYLESPWLGNGPIAVNDVIMMGPFGVLLSTAVLESRTLGANLAPTRVGLSVLVRRPPRPSFSVEAAI